MSFLTQYPPNQDQQLGRSPRDAVRRSLEKFGFSPSESVLARWRVDKNAGKTYIGPPFCRVGAKRIVYYDADWDRWMTEQRVEPAPLEPNPQKSEAQPEPLRRPRRRARRAVQGR